MNFLKLLYEEVIGFFGISHWLEMFKSGDYSSLQTLNGILGAIGPLLPLLFLFELIRGLIYKKFRIEDYRIPFFTYVFNRFISRFISIGMVGFCIALFEKHGIIKTRFTWYWLIYGYIVWEFAHFIYHYLAHKVRLLWCLHSTHHAPESMNLSVQWSHFFLEGAYADFIRTSICLLLGVNPALLFFIMFVDGTWGGFIHVGENLLKNGKLGFMEHVILTPSHHRVHHARNPLYMDTNFCNLLNIWDRAFGTYQPEQNSIAPEYGITRDINPGNFWDVYFGEVVALARDVARAPGLKNKLLYIVMPPGWSHNGDHKTAKHIRQSFMEQESKM